MYKVYGRYNEFIAFQLKKTSYESFSCLILVSISINSEFINVVPGKYHISKLLSSGRYLIKRVRSLYTIRAGMWQLYANHACYRNGAETKWSSFCIRHFQSFSCMNTVVIWFRFHWMLFPSVQLTTRQHWFRYWQRTGTAIIFTNNGPFYWCPHKCVIRLR